MGEFIERLVPRRAGRDLTLDVYPAAGRATRCAVLLLHGGGWGRGHRSEVQPYAAELARLGFVAIAVEYRLLGEAPWPAQILDVKDVIRWVRANAGSLNVDSDKIVAEGFSAGGHLALLAGGTAGKCIFGSEDPGDADAALNGIVSLFAPIDLTVKAFPRRPPPLKAMFGASGNEDNAEAASPVRHVGPAFPPTFLLNGVDDKFMPFQDTVQMFNVLISAGVKADLHLYHGHTHEFARLPSMLRPVQAEIALFLNRAVIDPAGYEKENIEQNPFASGNIG
jgi:acetyl esterase/lipase